MALANKKFNMCVRTKILSPQYLPVARGNIRILVNFTLNSLRTYETFTY